MSDTTTPRTDAESGDACEWSGYAQVVGSDFARILERELTAMTAQRDALREAGDKMHDANLAAFVVLFPIYPKLFREFRTKNELASLVGQTLLVKEIDKPVEQHILESLSAWDKLTK